MPYGEAPADHGTGDRNGCSRGGMSGTVAEQAAANQESRLHGLTLGGMHGETTVAHLEHAAQATGMFGVVSDQQHGGAV